MPIIGLTSAQADSIVIFRDIARENGATIEIVNDEFGCIIIETASAAFDRERTMWTLDRAGNAHIH